MTPTEVDEHLAVAALLRWHARHPGGEQRVERDPLAVLDIDSEDLVGMLIAREHGMGPEVLVAYTALARSRGVDLSAVIRAQLRGDLAAVVRLPVSARG